MFNDQDAAEKPASATQHMASYLRPGSNPECRQDSGPSFDMLQFSLGNVQQPDLYALKSQTTSSEATQKLLAGSKASRRSDHPKWMTGCPGLQSAANPSTALLMDDGNERSHQRFTQSLQRP